MNKSLRGYARSSFIFLVECAAYFIEEQRFKRFIKTKGFRYSLENLDERYNYIEDNWASRKLRSLQ